MPSILFRIFLLYNLINSILLSLVPKKLRFLLPPSWYHHHHQHQSNLNINNNNNNNNNVVPSIPSLTCLTSAASNEMDATEIKKVFQMFDKNGDERITKEELKQSLENLGICIGETELSQMVEKLDLNGDGCVDIDEFGELYQAIINERGDDGNGDGDGNEVSSKEEDMKDAFNVFDQNGDGFITVDELRSVLVSLGLKQGKTLEDCKRMIMNVDVDGDGMVSFKEFKIMMKGDAFTALS